MYSVKDLIFGKSEKNLIFVVSEDLFLEINLNFFFVHRFLNLENF